MTPLFFGPDTRRLFGVLSERPQTAGPGVGVVLCNAFGREAIRAHRLYRVLADRLSRSGCDVLRFDYFGTGDSAGDDAEIDLDGFGRDLLAAHEELLRRCGVTRVVWLGMRLGATVIQRSLAADSRRPSSVVYWDPIFDGRDYLDLLRRRAVESRTPAEELTGEIPPLFSIDSSAYLDEAIGFPMPRSFCDQLRAFRFAVPSTTDLSVSFIVDPGTDEGRAVASASRQANGVALAEAAHGTDWTREGDATGLVPANVMSLLVQRAGSAG